MKSWIVIVTLFLVSGAVFFTSLPKAENEIKIPSLEDLGVAIDLRFENNFDYSQLVPLEINEDFPFSNITDIIVTDKFIYFHDYDNVYQYNLDGSFETVIATKGQGPGEFQSIGQMKTVFDGNIAIFDYQSRKVRLFDSDGFYITSTPGRSTENSNFLPVGSAFVWDEKETLYISKVTLPEVTDDLHAITSLEWSDSNRISSISLIDTFGKRPLDHEEKFGQTNVNHFESIGSKIWYGSPYFARIVIYDLNGQTIKDFYPKVPKVLKPELYDGFTREDRRDLFRLVNLYGTIHDIQKLNEWVLVKIGASGYIFFDQEGNQLNTERIYCSLGNFWSTGYESAVFRVSQGSLHLVPNVENLIDDPALLEQEDTGQVYLLYGKLKDDFDLSVLNDPKRS